MPLTALVALGVLAGLLGLAIGSFLNVVIYRVPRDESVVSPASHCPDCNAAISGRHNIPVLGWLMLRGRCADCRAPISGRYPLVELLTGVLFVAMAVRLGSVDQLATLPAYLFLAAVGVALAFIDFDCSRLPNAIVLPCYPVLLLLLAAAAVRQRDWEALVRAVAGGAALYAFYFTLALISPGGMGFGDVKLAGLLGGAMGYLSWTTLLAGGFAAFVLGAVVGVAALATGRAGRKTALPFGPFMITAALGAVLVGAQA